MPITDHQAKYVAHLLTRRFPPDSVEKLAGAVASAQVDLNPHQIDAALFAFRSPLSKGALLADEDEVGLGKTIEAGLVLSQKWAERKRRILVITPSNLRKQWFQELSEKFFLPCCILEAKSYNAAIKQGSTRPFEGAEIVICSYQFAKSKATDVRAMAWDLVVIDEAHRLRNVYKPSNVIANALKDEEGRVWWGPSRAARPSIKRYLSEVGDLVPRTLWTKGDAGSNRTSKNEMRALFPGVSSFVTPKPERLIERLLNIATNPGDLVLDSFAGSGTTGAVAHKMGRRWIMVELGEHCHTHIIPRLKKVIDGEDGGGTTEAVGWKGGGGFRYYRLAPSLLEKDKWGNWVIHRDYNAAMLAEALCKLEGFTYAPSGAVYWQHGHSTERDFIYVTTATLNHEQLQQLSDEVGAEHSLLVLCPAFRGRGESSYANLTVKKIPKEVLSRCEWGHDDYSLRVENLPKAVPEPGRRPREGSASQSGLFDEGVE